MKELKITKTVWKTQELPNTFSEFEKGAKKSMIYPVITCEIPSGYNPMQRGNNDVFITIPSIGKGFKGTQIGYHVGNNEASFKIETHLDLFKSECPVKAYIV